MFTGTHYILIVSFFSSFLIGDGNSFSLISTSSPRRRTIIPQKDSSSCLTSTSSDSNSSNSNSISSTKDNRKKNSNNDTPNVSKNTKTNGESNNQNSNSNKLRTMYPPPQLISNGTIQVDSIHQLYFEEYGPLQEEQQPTTDENDNHNLSSASASASASASTVEMTEKTKTTMTALSLHGGPGAGCFPNHGRFFNSTLYDRIILYDQRGSGRSNPRGEIRNNTLEHLVTDIEQLREHLNIDKWDVVLGGSWGSTLALAYAQSYPSRVGGIVLRGVCLFRSKEIEWVFGDDVCNNQTSNIDTSSDSNNEKLSLSCVAELDTVSEQYNNNFKGSVNVDVDADVNEKVESSHPLHEKDMRRESLHRYYDYLLGDNVWDRIIAAKNWMIWEMSVSKSSEKIYEDINIDDAQLLIGRQSEAFFSLNKIEEDGSEIPLENTIEASTFRRWSQSEPEIDNMYDNSMLKVRPFTKRSNLQRTGDKQLANITEEYLQTFIPSQAMLTNYYSVNNEFMMSKFDLLSKESIDRIRHIPCIAIQGGHDPICPPDSALDLKHVWPEIELRIVISGKHSQYDPQITSELIKATDYIARRNEY